MFEEERDLLLINALDIFGDHIISNVFEIGHNAISNSTVYFLILLFKSERDRVKEEEEEA
jgi:hypothetical protein